MKKLFAVPIMFLFFVGFCAAGAQLTGQYPGFEAEYEFIETKVISTGSCAACTSQGEPINPSTSEACCPEVSDKETIQLPNGGTYQISGINRPADSVVFTVNQQPDPDCAFCDQYYRTYAVTIEDLSSGQGCPDVMLYTYFVFHPDDPASFPLDPGATSYTLLPSNTVNQPSPTDYSFAGELPIPIVPGTLRVWSYSEDCNGDQVKEARTVEVSLYKFQSTGSSGPSAQPTPTTDPYDWDWDTTSTPTPYQYGNECEDDFDCDPPEVCIGGYCKHLYDDYDDDDCCGSSLIMLGGAAFILTRFLF